LTRSKNKGGEELKIGNRQKNKGGNTKEKVESFRRGKTLTFRFKGFPKRRIGGTR